MRKQIRLISFVLSVMFVFSGCNSNSKDEELQALADEEWTTMELQLNDYRGGVVRTFALKEHILSIMENMKRNNSLIRNDSPNSFWNTQGYQDFVATFLTQPIINDTQWFNEEEDENFDELVDYIGSVNNSFTSGNEEDGYKFKNSNISIVKNEKDDYSITGIDSFFLSDKTYSGKLSYRILYDCDKDWCKAYTMLDISSQYISSPVTTELFEYARIDDNTFAIQTSTERLLVKLADVESDTDIRDRDIVEFYYSRLSGGQRTTYSPYEQLPEYDENGKEIKANTTKNKEINKYPLINEKGEPATIYGINNSLFLLDKVSAIDYKWVFEDKALQQAIIYKNNTLVVTSYNKLTTRYERFIYSIEQIDPKLVKDIENMVKIEGLVGVVAVKTTEIVPVVTTANTSEASTSDLPPESTSIENSDVDTTITSDDTSIDTSDGNADITTSPEESIDNTEISVSDTSNESETSITAETSITDAETTAPISDTADETTSTEAGV